MCGIGGYWGPAYSRDHLDAAGQEMRRALARRGPDANDAYVDMGAGLLLVHTRLSIRDLSASGAQPMRSADGRYTIVYNGELYGTQVLRGRLERRGTVLRGHSDTEVLLETVATVGVEAAVKSVEGIFAFAVWDARERRLWLARDRVGVKPLYVARPQHGQGVAFASDLAALACAPGFSITPSPAVAESFFRLGYVPDTACVAEGVRKVQPGELWSYSAPSASPREATYHDRRGAALEGLREPIRDPRVAVDELARTLGAAVERQLVADVPVGVFLSGGIDSSAVAAAAAGLRRAPVKTFSIGFDDPRYDESASARTVAAHLGTEHFERILRPDDLLSVVEDVASAFSEPFADSSMLPTWAVCRFAREHVTVALSGDGGDELFAGYNRHVWLPRVAMAQRATPQQAAAAFRSAVASLQPEKWDRLLRWAPVRTPGLKLHKVARLLCARGERALVEEVTRTNYSAASFVAGATGALEATQALDCGDALARLTYHDFVTYLPGDILTKVDRCSMHHGLEARVPLLDESLVSLAARLTNSLKVRHGTSKWVLREVLARSVPRAMFERPKMGFAVPLGDWLRGPLRPWAEELLSLRSLQRSPVLDATAVQAVWRAFLQGEPLLEFALWSVLMWQTWSTRLMAPRALPAASSLTPL